ncbi:MAG TPA: hypothetical protein VLF93_02910 [Candidatus Saccharimonadales bacterium]|nr:hypothetical protein [Candidatus Saccharimonadales bacterium]
MFLKEHIELALQISPTPADNIGRRPLLSDRSKMLHVDPTLAQEVTEAQDPVIQAPVQPERRSPATYSHTSRAALVAAAENRPIPAVGFHQETTSNRAARHAHPEAPTSLVFELPVQTFSPGEPIDMAPQVDIDGSVDHSKRMQAVQEILTDPDQTVRTIASLAASAAMRGELGGSRTRNLGVEDLPIAMDLFVAANPKIMSQLAEPKSGPRKAPTDTRGQLSQPQLLARRTARLRAAGIQS